MQGWTTSGPQNVTWQRANSDNLNFTALLTNQVLPNFTSQVLAALVNGTTGATVLYSQNGGFPTGDHFRLDFVLNSTELNTILAQSPEFSISDNSSTSSTTTGSTVATSSLTSPTDTSDSSGTSGTSPSIIPTSSNGGAASFYPVQTGFLVLISLLGFALA